MCCVPGQSYQYHLIREDDDRHLYHLYHPLATDDFDLEEPIRPVEGTKKWLATRLYYLKGSHVGVTLIVFDGQKVYRKHKFSNCPRSARDYGFQYRKDNAEIFVHTLEGEFLYNVGEDRLTKLNADASAESQP